MDGQFPARLTESDRAAAGVRLRDAGLRATGPRRSLLALLETWEGHHAVDDLAGALDDLGRALPRQSIYNVLADLVDVGLALPADTGPGRALYERSSTWHHHFVCITCDRVLDVPCTVGAKPCLDASVPGAEVHEAQVILRGHCPDCRGGPPLAA